MDLSKSFARKILLPATIRLGIDKMLLNRSKHSCCIINFHGVRRSETKPLNNRHLDIVEFENLLRHLKSRFDIVPLSKIFEIHRSKKTTSRKTVALTFDDGYLNNFTLAFPILKRLNIPATFFIISKSLESQDYLAWPDIADLVKHSKKENLILNGETFQYPGFVSEKGQLGEYLKTLGSETEKTAQQILRQHPEISNLFRLNDEIFRLVDPVTLKKFASEPLLELGSHSHSHLCMQYLNEGDARSEYDHSSRLLSDITGRKIKSYAFPDGSYTPSIAALARESGYENVVAVDYKFNESNNLPYLLSRFTVSNSTTANSNLLRLALQFDKYGFC